MNLNLAILIVVTVLNSFLGLIIFLGGKHRVNIIFSTLILSVILWSVANYLAEILSSEPLVRFLIGFTYAVAIIIAMLFLKFSLIFPSAEKKTPTFKNLLIYLFSLVFILMSFSRLVVKDVRIVEPRNSLTSGPGITIFMLYFLFIMLIAFITLFRRYFKSEGIERRQVFYIILGTVLSVAGGSITNLVLPFITGNWDISRYGPYFTIFLIGFSSYAILRHHLFSIKIIATELLTFTIWVFLLIRTLLAETLRDQIIDGGLLILVVGFGILLIRSVIKEVEQREKLEVLNKKLEELNRQKSEFLSFASHQVKAPMAIVKGFAQLIYDGILGAVPDKVKETSQKIINSANKMIALVGNLLDLRKLEEGKMEYNFTEVNINELVNDTIEELRQMAQGKKLDLTFTGLANEIKIKADPQKLSQVIQNFVDNAIKYTDQGWVRVSVKYQASSVKDKEGVLITVSDSGRGLSLKLQSHLFEQFSRDSETAKEIQGTGLGLYIAKQIVEAHRGKIWAESEGDNKGSTFFVEIPLS